MSNQHWHIRHAIKFSKKILQCPNEEIFDMVGKPLIEALITRMKDSFNSDDVITYKGRNVYVNSGLYGTIAFELYGNNPVSNLVTIECMLTYNFNFNNIKAIEK